MPSFMFGQEITLKKLVNLSPSRLLVKPQYHLSLKRQVKISATNRHDVLKLLGEATFSLVSSLTAGFVAEQESI